MCMSTSLWQKVDPVKEPPGRSPLKWLTSYSIKIDCSLANSSTISVCVERLFGNCPLGGSSQDLDTWWRTMVILSPRTGVVPLPSVTSWGDSPSVTTCKSPKRWSRSSLCLYFKMRILCAWEGKVEKYPSIPKSCCNNCQDQNSNS